MCAAPEHTQGSYVANGFEGHTCGSGGSINILCWLVCTKRNVVELDCLGYQVPADYGACLPAFGFSKLSARKSATLMNLSTRGGTHPPSPASSYWFERHRWLFFAQYGIPLNVSELIWLYQWNLESKNHPIRKYTPAERVTWLRVTAS